MEAGPTVYSANTALHVLNVWNCSLTTATTRLLKRKYRHGGDVILPS